MRVFLLGVVAASFVCSAEAQAEPKAVRPARSVQLIAMGATVKADVAVPASPARQDDDIATDALSAVADFKVHDLGRRWIEFQMANSFAGENGTRTPVENGDLLVQVGVAEPNAYTAQMAVPPTSSIPVPLWMRRGPVFASAAYSYVPGCSALGYRPTDFLASDAELRRANYYDLMSMIACQYGVPVGLFDAMIIQESRYRPDALSPKSAFGLTQLMPGTAVALGVNRYSVEENLRGGAKYLRQQLDRFGQYHLALAAYNAGPGRVRNGLVPQIAETQAYVGNVMQNWARLSGGYRRATITSPAPATDTTPPRPAGRNAAVFTF